MSNEELFNYFYKSVGEIIYDIHCNKTYILDDYKLYNINDDNSKGEIYGSLKSKYNYRRVLLFEN